MGEEDIILPSDYQPEPTEQDANEPTQPQDDSNITESESEPATTPADEQTVEETPKQTIKVVYNGQDQEINMDDAVPLLQKGLNYDKLMGKLTAAESDPRLEKFNQVSQLANLFGYQSEDGLIEALLNQYYQNTADSQGLTPEQVKKDYELQQREAKIQNQIQSAEQERARNAMYDRFIARFPDAGNNIKPETWALVQSGMDLTAAYIEQRNQELEQQLKATQQNIKNKKAAVVSGTQSQGSAPTKSDPFLDGFNSIR